MMQKTMLLPYLPCSSHKMLQLKWWASKSVVEYGLALKEEVEMEEKK